MALDKLLKDNNLYSIDVNGDGNCFCRALSVCIYGHQNDHVALRSAISQYVLSQSLDAPLSDREALRCMASYIAKGGTWAAEDIVLAAAHSLQRVIYVYAAGIPTPLEYRPPSSSTNHPLLLALYEPGHYRAVAHVNTDTCVFSQEVNKSSVVRNDMSHIASTSLN
jgi:OTU-like cysteine protease